jgi:hypothetical protein
MVFLIPRAPGRATARQSSSRAQFYEAAAVVIYATIISYWSRRRPFS